MGAVKGDTWADIGTRLARRSYVADNGCWIWTGGKRTGYGMISVGTDVSRSAHVVAYEFFVGPIPDGLTLDHLCHNADPSDCTADLCLHRACWNPDHLDPVPRGLNVNRSPLVQAARRRRTVCTHDMTDPSNVRTDKRGRLRCRACAQRLHAKRPARVRVAA